MDDRGGPQQYREPADDEAEPYADGYSGYTGYDDYDEYDERHRAQRRRTLLVIGGLVLLLFFGFWYAFSYYRSSSGGPSATPRPSATCRTVDPKVPQPSQTRVNVYNATSRNGLAAGVGRDLEARGFVLGSVRNDPLKKTVTGPAEVRYGPAGASRARVVAAIVGKGAVLVKDTRKDTSVDLVLGNTFSALIPGAAASLPVCGS